VFVSKWKMKNETYINLKKDDPLSA